MIILSGNIGKRDTRSKEDLFSKFNSFLGIKIKNEHHQNDVHDVVAGPSLWKNPKEKENIVVCWMDH